jgi:hypothetical protein
MPDYAGNLLPGDIGYVQPGAGLINADPSKTTVAASTPVTGYTPTTGTAVLPKAVGYDPNSFSVTPDQTVAENVKKIVASDSPLMQQAATRASMKMNERGLLNSSQAIGAGQAAVYDAALPIAQQDAGAYERANTNTVNAKNAAAGFKATADNQASQVGAQLGTDMNKANAASFNTALGQQADAAMRMNLAKLDVNTKQSLAILDAQNRQLLQANVTAGNMFQEIVGNIAGIAADPGLSKEAKDSATATQLNLLNEGLRMATAITTTEQAAVAGLNLNRYFDSSPAGAPRPAYDPDKGPHMSVTNFAGGIIGIYNSKTGLSDYYDSGSGRVTNTAGTQVAQMPPGMTAQDFR